MDDTTPTMYRPDTISPPGETLADLLDDRELTQAELAERMGRPKKTINEIIRGKAAITAETALQLERVLGVPAGFWLRREHQYREFLARQNEAEALTHHLDWLQQLPMRDMIQLQFIQHQANPLDQLREVLAFFGIATPAQRYYITAALRRSTAFTSDEEALRVWLRQGERFAEERACAPFNERGFRDLLQHARTLTREPIVEAWTTITRQCAEVGVVAVIVPELPRTRVCGATRWLAPDKALIQLSLRYKTDDQFWFSFFHEAAHLLLHSKRDAFLDEDAYTSDPQEAEANQFAQELLIPAADFQRLLRRRGAGHFSRDLITRFAEEIGIAPGIVVGRLHHAQKLPKTHLHGLKQKLSPDLMPLAEQTPAPDPWRNWAALREQIRQEHPAARVADRLDADRRERDAALRSTDGTDDVHP